MPRIRKVQRYGVVGFVVMFTMETSRQKSAPIAFSRNPLSKKSKKILKLWYHNCLTQKGQLLKHEEKKGVRFQVSAPPLALKAASLIEKAISALLSL